MITPLRYALDLHPFVDRETFEGEVSIEIAAEQPVREVLLDSVGLQIERATIDGVPVPYRLTADGVILGAPEPLGHAVVHLAFRGEFHRSGRGLFRSGDCAATQLQPVYARRVFPCFDDPRFKTPFALRVTADPGHVAIASAPLHAVEPSGERQRFVFSESPPTPTHLLGLAVGPFETIAAQVGGIPLRVSSMAGAEQATFVLETAARLLASHAAVLGVPYPWPKLDIVLLPQSEAAGLETTSMLFLRQPAIVTEGAAARDTVRLIAHELAHQWFGSLVTPAAWSDLWLSEGFATWLAARAIDTDVETARATRAVMAVDSLPSARPLRSAPADAGGVLELYDAIAYQKGAAVLRMLEGWLGETAFARGVRRFLDTHAHATATAEDLCRALRTETGEDVDGIVAGFIAHAGAPLLRIGVEGAAVRIAHHGAQRAIPVVLKAGLEDGSIEHHRVLLAGPSASVLAGGNVAWIVGNAANGYYRCSLADPTAVPPDAISDAEALGIIADTWAELWEGATDILVYLRVFERLFRPALKGIAEDHVTEIRRLLASGAREGAFGAWAARFSVPLRSGRSAGDLEELLGDPATQRGAWEQLKASWEQLPETAVSFGGRGPIEALGVIADRGLRQDIASFFAGRLGAGAERTVRQALEVIDSRIAFREREQWTFDAWLSRLSAPGVAVDGTLGASYALLNVLTAGFHGASVHRTWLEALRAPVPGWMQPSADLTRLTHALEQRMLAAFAGHHHPDPALRNLGARLQEDLLAAAASLEGGAKPLASVLARQLANEDRLFRGAIAFAHLFGNDAAANALRARRRAGFDRKSRIDDALRRVAMGEAGGELHQTLEKESAPLGGLLRSQAAELGALMTTASPR